MFLMVPLTIALCVAITALSKIRTVRTASLALAQAGVRVSAEPISTASIQTRRPTLLSRMAPSLDELFRHIPDDRISYVVVSSDAEVRQLCLCSARLSNLKNIVVHGNGVSMHGMVRLQESLADLNVGEIELHNAITPRGFQQALKSTGTKMVLHTIYKRQAADPTLQPYNDTRGFFSTDSSQLSKVPTLDSLFNHNNATNSVTGDDEPFTVR